MTRGLKRFAPAALALLVCFSVFPGAARAGDRPLLIPGENLEFRIRYGGMPAGIARLKVESCEGPRGELYRITSEARSNDFVSLFYKVDDRVIAELDADTYQIRRFEKDLREGPFEKHMVFTCDEDVVRSGEQYPGPKPGTRDVLSALYYVRGMDLSVGDELEIETFEGGKIYRARVKVIGEETVTTPAGDFDCLVIEPEIEEGIFGKAGRLVMWVTDDALKIPVLVKSTVSVGSFVAELIGSSHLGGE
ncbi:MAG: DUF3108 domain-containing protein [bacterium]|jgi:hypothetical protein